jgi:hypothetical protein
MLKSLKPKIEIVELRNGKFAVRKTFFGEQTFYDPYHTFFPWKKANDCLFTNCQFKKLEKAQEIYHRVTSSIVVRVVFP